MTLIASSETLCVSAAVHSVVLQGKVVIYLNWHPYIILFKENNQGEDPGYQRPERRYCCIFK